MLYASVEMNTTPFDRAYARVVRKFSMLGTEADRAAAGTTALDDSLITTARAADKASTSIGRTTATTRSSTVADERAAAAAAMHARAVSEVSTVMARSTAATQREVQAVLRDVAAQQRAVAVRAELGSAAAMQAREISRVAGAEAAAIGSTQRLTAVQREAAVATTRLAASQREAASMGLVGGNRMSHGLTLPIIAAAAVATKMAVKFQSAMLLIHTQAGRSTAEVKKMTPAVLALAGKTATAPLELAKSLYHVASVGVPAAKALDVVRIAAEGAKIGHADLEQTTNALTSTFVSGIKGAGNFAHAMGMLNAVVGAGDMRMTDLNQALGSGVLTVIKQYGVTLRDAGAALAVFGDNNIRGAHAGTMLRMAVQALAVPAKGGSKILGELGLTSEGSAKALGKLHLTTATLSSDMVKGGLNLALHDLRKHLVGAGVDGDHMGTILTQAFGKKAGPGLQVLIGQMSRFDQKFKQVWEGGNKFGQDWQAWLHSTAGRFDTLKATVQSLGISIGTVLLPVVTGLATGFGHVFSFIQEHSTVFKVLAIGILGVAGAIKAVGIALAVQAKIAAFAEALQVGALKVGAFFGSTSAAAKLSSMETTAAMARQTTAVEGSVAAQVAALERLAVAEGEAAAGGGVGRGRMSRKLGTGVGMLAGAGLMVGGHFVDNGKAGTARNRAGTIMSDAGAGALMGGMVGGPWGAAAGAVLGGTWGAVSSEGNMMAKAFAKASQYAAAHNLVMKAGTKAQKDMAMSAGMTNKVVTLAKKVYGETTTSIKDMSKADQQYAMMAGLVADKNGRVTGSSKAVGAAIRTVSTAYNTATSTGSAFLASLDTFSKSAGTAADRAALIGATLKANAGDSLSFASSMNAAAVAVTQLGKDVSGKLLGQVVDLKSGTIAYSKSAAAPLIKDLESVQTAAISAAEATYQHNVSLVGGKRAADLAVTGYSGVESSLVRQLRSLGLTTTQAQRLTNKYLGVPKNVRTLIEAQGTNPVVTVLNKIGRLLAYLTGQPWDPKVGVSDRTAAPLSAIDRKMRGIVDRRYVATIDVTANISSSAVQAQNLLNNVAGSSAFRLTNRASRYATGGKIPPNTRFTVGEEGWEGGETDSQGRATIFSHPQAKAMGFAAPVGYASGSGSNYAAIAGLLGSMGATRAGIAGWLGNTSIESGGRTTAHNPGENAWGFQQWEGGRLGVLQGIASRLHVGITSQAAQLAMIRHELTHGYGDTLHMLRTARSPGAAAAYVDANYERSSGAARGARMSAAAQFYRSGVSAALGGSVGAGSVARSVSPQQQLANAAANLAKVAHHMRSTAAQLNTAGAKLTASGAALHASSATLRQAAGYQRMINADAARRTTLVSRLAAAQNTYKSLQQKRAADWTTFVAPTRDAFNISDASQYAAATTTSRQAGATITTTTPGGISLASILASDKAAAGTARRFGADLSALARRGLNKTDVAALAAAGPSADPVARALLGASRSQIAGLNANRTSINSSAGKMAFNLAHQFNDAGMNAATSLAHGLESQIGRLDHTIERLADHMTSALKRRLRIHSPSQVFHDLGTMLPKGLANGIHEKLPEVRRAAGHMADATMPGFGSGTGGSGFAVQHQTVINPAPGMSEREIGRAAAMDAVWQLQMIGGLPT